ncbi:P-loop containing nucleoside triphosphate hydrolase [Podospora aff. communis PSN243]|uniref:P-loop containing nucleoside triphosphate hydrolase n=1 Tax=Podospora aff. communis PSN243 TaxID=3040156 RepID=A0AAV9H3A9_9PEZI|nr:P-loop containing nucleoside triphosphate hydrolase [Podospora aff. communis PSN243]
MPDKSIGKYYEHDCHGGHNCNHSHFSEFPSRRTANKAFEERIKDQHAIIQRFKKDGDIWETSKFTVRSTDMQEILSEAMSGYPDWRSNSHSWTFEPPYTPLVHRWDRILGINKQLASEVSDKTDDTCKKAKAAAELVEFLKPLLSPSIGSIAEARDTKQIAFKDVWQILPPGELAMTEFLEEKSICRVASHEGGQDSSTALVVWIETVMWNGREAGIVKSQRTIEPYDGVKDVTSLDIHPLSYVDDVEEVKRKMIARGRKYEKLRGRHFQMYRGQSYTMDYNLRTQSMSGRVMIDNYAYCEIDNVEKTAVEPLEPALTPDAATESADEAGSSYASVTSVANDREEDLTPFTDEHCLLARPWVTGMDFEKKEWAKFLVDGLTDIEWNDQPFENLVLPEADKQLAWDFVESKAHFRQDYDDFISTKGRGLMILMFGPPGVGKTFTAEAVSEKARVPLYSIGAGMLGSFPSDVEAELGRVLKLCTMWNAMLLIDEADVFLGTRTDEGLARNELVSIFLTKLEYYQGILFMTTNRIQGIDHAFQSRIDLFLPYRDLGSEARRKVWENTMNHLGRDRFEADDAMLDRLSKLALNGREIKNLVKTAQLLSHKTGGFVTSEKLCMLAEKRVDVMQMMQSAGLGSK